MEVITLAPRSAMRRVGDIDQRRTSRFANIGEQWAARCMNLPDVAAAAAAAALVDDPSAFVVTVLFD